MAIHLTDDVAADDLLTHDPLALLIGMLLDQQVAMELAFAGPLKIQQRLGAFDAQSIAASDPEELIRVFKQTPAVHRFPSSMAARVQMLCRVLVDEWRGDASALWTDGDPGGDPDGDPDGNSDGHPDGPTVLKRLKKLPGFSEQKAKIFLALLGKQCGFDGAGWREAAGAYGEAGSFRSVADIVSPETLRVVREHKKAAKKSAKKAAKEAATAAAKQTSDG